MTKNTLKIDVSKTWCKKKLVGYQVAHHKYLLTSCQMSSTYTYFFRLTTPL